MNILRKILIIPLSLVIVPCCAFGLILALLIAGIIDGTRWVFTGNWDSDLGMTACYLDLAKEGWWILCRAWRGILA